MKEIALIELSQEQMPERPSDFQSILERNGIIGDFCEKEENLILENHEVTLEFSFFQNAESDSPLNDCGIEISGKGDDYAITETIIDLQEIFEIEFEDAVFSSEYLEEDNESWDDDDNDDTFLLLFDKIVELAEFLKNRGIQLDVNERNEFGEIMNTEIYSSNNIEKITAEYLTVQNQPEEIDLNMVNPLFEAYFAKNFESDLDGHLFYEDNRFEISWKMDSGEIKRIQVSEFLKKLKKDKVSSYERYVELVKKHSVYR